MATPQQDGDAFDALRVAWRDILTGGDFDGADPLFADALARMDGEVQRLVDLVVRDPGRDRVFADLPPFTDPAGDVSLEATYRQLRSMARGYATVGSRWQGNADLLADILAGLETTNIEIYHVGQPGFGNWWNWQIGAPRPFMDTCTLVHEHLDAATLDRYLAVIDYFVQDARDVIYLQYDDPNAHRATAVGANRVDLCRSLFPRGAALRGRREERTGRWSDINHDGPTNERMRRYLTLWIDHGVDPHDESYTYIVVPGATRDRTAALAGSPPVQLLTNSTSLQAVHVPRLGITAANFWTPGSVRGIKTTEPCSLLMRKSGGELTVAIADPTHEQVAVNITLRQPGYRSWTGDDTITVHNVFGEISFTVNTQNAQGATHTITFSLSRTAAAR